MARGLKNIAKLLNTINDDIPVEQQFLYELTKSIEMTEAKDTRKSSLTYKPSYMSCIRGNYYQLTGEEPEEDSRGYSLVGIAESGTDRHIRIQQAIEQMKDNGFDCEYIDIESFIKQRKLSDIAAKEKSGMETKCYNKSLNMSFLTDGIVKFKGRYYIFEFKTEISTKWWQRTGVDPRHYNQAIAYALNFQLDNVLFVYENRDTCQKKCYLFHVDEDMKMNLMGYIANCDNYVRQYILPPKPEEAGTKFCQYCNYKRRCDRDGC